ncbi:recombinase family protein [Anaerotignum propionicum]|uniref:Recombinase n=1 Tax=Anaerotignum propionicum DSM 1682 TaxID=991789 RepID=A0A0X8VDG8_ANAPI|nr:recombinase family protein [Anaerotignum propionicum]AMJ41727.1 recombinase [Anaerotignum propionicum DSM 1682]SHE83315.1 Site-specific DNA recombinase [[Clostridium] propionicum DSM 1682] [Anaerotignum propionicum DSM 1682]
MARKSRKNLEHEVLQEPMHYHTGIYVRLSVEDTLSEGSSIENQILLGRKFIEEQKDLIFFDSYIDNGQTGTHFNRPAFLRLMEDVEAGRIQCVIVKDFSRFGRNYLQVGEYLENIFPRKKVRFISVNDNFDSNFKGNQDDLIVPLKSILHDSYAKDISKKVSTSIDVKKKNGNFMSGKPPYGYIRSKTHPYKLIIQKEAAEIVKKIFCWRIEGLGVSVIAARLNEMGIPTWGKLHLKQWNQTDKDFWYGSTVTNILKNPCYLGCLVERKSEKVLYKGGVSRVIPQEEWNMIEHTHEPIISPETFYQVQRIMNQRGEKI